MPDMDLRFPPKKLFPLDHNGFLGQEVFRIFWLILRVFHETLTGEMEGAKMACPVKEY